MKQQATLSQLTLLRLVLVSLTFVTIIGCAGGGTIGTGLTPTGFGGRKQSSRISFDLVGTLVNTRNVPISQALVTIETSFGLVTRKTDGYGRFRAPLSIVSGEYIKIDVQHQNLHYNQRQQISPAGASEVMQTIKIESDGSLGLE